MIPRWTRASLLALTILALPGCPDQNRGGDSSPSQAPDASTKKQAASARTKAPRAPAHQSVLKGHNGTLSVLAGPHLDVAAIIPPSILQNRCAFTKAPPAPLPLEGQPNSSYYGAVRYVTGSLSALGFSAQVWLLDSRKKARKRLLALNEQLVSARLSEDKERSVVAASYAGVDYYAFLVWKKPAVVLLSYDKGRCQDKDLKEIVALVEENLP